MLRNGRGEDSMLLGRVPAVSDVSGRGPPKRLGFLRVG